MKNLLKMELTKERDQSLHVRPYADMIDRMTYVQKADFAKYALDLERDCMTYKKLYEETLKERDGWIAEYRAAKAEVERLKQERDTLKWALTTEDGYRHRQEMINELGQQIIDSTKRDDCNG